MEEPKSLDATPIKIGNMRIVCSNTILPCYHAVVIPYAESGATEWHPTESTGPFSTLTRGAFASKAEADRWAQANLAGLPYSVREYPV
jgi:hypothetical protein